MEYKNYPPEKRLEADPVPMERDEGGVGEIMPISSRQHSVFCKETNSYSLNIRSSSHQFSIAVTSIIW